VFVLEIEVGSDYPYMPPKLRFETRILHPNIASETGVLLFGEGWRASYQIYEVLLAVRRLLVEPDLVHSDDRVVKEMFMNEHANFIQTARAWTDAYAAINFPQVLSPARSTYSEEFAALVAETSVSDPAILRQAADVTANALHAVGSDSVCMTDVAAILNCLAQHCPQLQEVLHAYGWVDCEFDQRHSLDLLHGALEHELAKN
jgi:hypothetical protein